MPFFPGSTGKVFYRHWAAASPIAQIVFLHGYGEHSGLYHRFAFCMNARDIDVWALDEIGHGLTEGERGDPVSIDALCQNADRLTRIASDGRPELPVVIVGHSMGGVVAAVLACKDGHRFCGLVLSGTPLEPLNETQLAQLADGVMSEEPFYLDELEHDPLLKWDVGNPSLLKEKVLAPEALARIQGQLPSLSVPALLIRGEHDFICPSATVDALLTRLPDAQGHMFAGAHHDVLNDTTYTEVAALIANAVLGWVGRVRTVDLGVATQAPLED